MCGSKVALVIYVRAYILATYTQKSHNKGRKEGRKGRIYRNRKGVEKEEEEEGGGFSDGKTAAVSLRTVCMHITRVGSRYKSFLK